MPLIMRQLLTRRAPPMMNQPSYMEEAAPALAPESIRRAPRNAERNSNVASLVGSRVSSHAIKCGKARPHDPWPGMSNSGTTRIPCPRAYPTSRRTCGRSDNGLLTSVWRKQNRMFKPQEPGARCRSRTARARPAPSACGGEAKAKGNPRRPAAAVAAHVSRRVRRLRRPGARLRELRERLGAQRERLGVREVPVEHVQLRGRHCVNRREQEPHWEEVPRGVDQEASVGEPGGVVHLPGSARCVSLSSVAPFAQAVAKGAGLEVSVSPRTRLQWNAEGDSVPERALDSLGQRHEAPQRSEGGRGRQLARACGITVTRCEVCDSSFLRSELETAISCGAFSAGGCANCYPVSRLPRRCAGCSSRQFPGPETRRRNRP